jgi:hypothetical protein
MVLIFIIQLILDSHKAPLSLILFNIYTSSVHDIIGDEGVFFQFAEDFAILVSGNNFDAISRKMNTILINVKAAFNNLNLKINLDKSSTICFTTKFQDNMNMCIDIIPIRSDPYHKYLGITIDHQLKFKKTYFRHS